MDILLNVTIIIFKICNGHITGCNYNVYLG